MPTSFYGPIFGLIKHSVRRVLPHAKTGAAPDGQIFNSLSIKRENRGRTPRFDYITVFSEHKTNHRDVTMYLSPCDIYAPKYAFLISGLASSSLPVPVITTLPVSST